MCQLCTPARVQQENVPPYPESGPACEEGADCTPNCPSEFRTLRPAPPGAPRGVSAPHGVCPTSTSPPRRVLAARHRPAAAAMLSWALHTLSLLVPSLSQVPLLQLGDQIALGLVLVGAGWLGGMPGLTSPQPRGRAGPARFGRAVLLWRLWRRAVRCERAPGPGAPGAVASSFSSGSPCLQGTALSTQDSRLGRLWRKLGFPPLGGGAAVSSRAGAGLRHGEARHVGGSARDACLAGAGGAPRQEVEICFPPAANVTSGARLGSAVSAAALQRRGLRELLARPSTTARCPGSREGRSG